MFAGGENNCWGGKDTRASCCGLVDSGWGHSLLLVLGVMKEDSWKVRDDEKRVDSLEERGATCWIVVEGDSSD